MRSKKFEAYVERVVSILSAEFGWDETTEGICRDVLRTGHPFGAGLELICDEPSIANWRLKADRASLSLRMAYYGWGDSGREREARVTQQLEAARRDVFG